MNITRNNYEEFFMLYADNELTAAQRETVEAFIGANPDLQHELALFHQFKVSPDTAVVFNNKTALMKPEEGHLNITATDYESFFVLYADDELTNNEKAGVEDFVYRNPQLQDAFELLQQVKLTPDTSIVFENKESLYRKEKDDKVVPFRWWRLAAAAAVILFVSGIFWLNKDKKNDQQAIAGNNPVVKPVKQPSPQTTEKKAAGKDIRNEQPAKETIALTGIKKDNQQEKNTRAARAIAVAPGKEMNRNRKTVPAVQAPEIHDEIAGLNKKEFKNADIHPIHEQPKSVEPEKNLLAAGANALPDQPSIILNPNENDNQKAVFASFNNDNVEVLNTSVNTKSSLRGFLRKASRLIAKKTNGNDDGNRKGILIGGFEIAVR